MLIAHNIFGCDPPIKWSPDPLRIFYSKSWARENRPILSPDCRFRLIKYNPVFIEDTSHLLVEIECRDKIEG